MDTVVNSSRASPQAAPQATERPYRSWAASAIAMRCCRVSSRKRAMRPARAAAASPSPAGGSASVPTTVISSRSMVSSTGPVNQPSGSRPANQPATSARSSGGALS
jgi:hypothetical protein